MLPLPILPENSPVYHLASLRYLIPSLYKGLLHIALYAAYQVLVNCRECSHLFQRLYRTGLLDWTTGLDYWTGLLDWTTGLDYWTGLLDWTTGLDYWTGLLDWTTGLDYWTGLLDWTTGLISFTTKFMLVV